MPLSVLNYKGSGDRLSGVDEGSCGVVQTSLSADLRIMCVVARVGDSSSRRLTTLLYQAQDSLFLGEIPVPATSCCFTGAGQALVLGYGTDDGPKVSLLNLHVSPTGSNPPFTVHFSYTKRLSADSQQGVSALAHQPGSGSFVATIGGSSRLYVVCDDVQRGVKHASLKVASSEVDQVRCFKFSDDGGFLASATDSGMMSVLKCGDGYMYKDLAVSPSPTSKSKRVVNLASVFRFRNSSPVSSFCWNSSHRDSLVISTAHDDGSMRVWEPARRPTVVDTFFFGEEDAADNLMKPTFTYPKTVFAKLDGVACMQATANPWQNLVSITGAAGPLGCKNVMVAVGKNGCVKVLGFNRERDDAERGALCKRRITRGGVKMPTLMEALDAESVRIVNEERVHENLAVSVVGGIIKEVGDGLELVSMTEDGQTFPVQIKPQPETFVQALDLVEVDEDPILDILTDHAIDPSENSTTYCSQGEMQEDIQDIDEIGSEWEARQEETVVAPQKELSFLKAETGADDEKGNADNNTSFEISNASTIIANDEELNAAQEWTAQEVTPVKYKPASETEEKEEREPDDIKTLQEKNEELQATVQDLRAEMLKMQGMMGQMLRIVADNRNAL